MENTEQRGFVLQEIGEIIANTSKDPETQENTDLVFLLVLLMGVIVHPK